MTEITALGVEPTARAIAVMMVQVVQKQICPV